MTRFIAMLLATALPLSCLAVDFFTADGNAPDPAQVTRWAQLAEAGDAEATNNLGVLYLTGEGLREDHARAAALFRQAAGRGSTSAMVNLAEMHRRGQGGMPHSLDTFISLNRKAAALGNTDAFESLGFAYLGGVGVNGNKFTAMKYYMRAARLGSVSSMMMLAEGHIDGTFFGRNGEVALQYYRAAAIAGHHPAAVAIGDAYLGLNGVPAPHDPAEALRWYQRGAEAGHGPSMLRLASTALSGRSGTVDHASAVLWGARAHAAGEATASAIIRKALAPLPLVTTGAIEAVIRDAPRVSAPALADLPKSSPLSVLADQGDGWLMVYSAERGLVGYIDSVYLDG